MDTVRERAFFRVLFSGGPPLVHCYKALKNWARRRDGDKSRGINSYNINTRRLWCVIRFLPFRRTVYEKNINYALLSFLIVSSITRMPYTHNTTQRIYNMYINILLYMHIHCRVVRFFHYYSCFGITLV